MSPSPRVSRAPTSPTRAVRSSVRSSDRHSPILTASDHRSRPRVDHSRDARRVSARRDSFTHARRRVSRPPRPPRRRARRRRGDVRQTTLVPRLRVVARERSRVRRRRALGGDAKVFPSARGQPTDETVRVLLVASRVRPPTHPFVVTIHTQRRRRRRRRRRASRSASSSSHARETSIDPWGRGTRVSGSNGPTRMRGTL